MHIQNLTFVRMSVMESVQWLLDHSDDADIDEVIPGMEQKSSDEETITDQPQGATAQEVSLIYTSLPS